ncbi:MAG: hypothetical protein AAFY71_28240 [Bacteroidota bacterium]
MTFQEKRSIVNAISILLIAALFSWFIWQHYPFEEILGSFSLIFWGNMILLLIPIQIASNVLLNIIFSIFNKVITNEDEVHMTDERDKMIELRCTRNGCYVLLLGLMLSMLPLVFGLSAHWTFGGIMISLFLMQLTWTGSEFYYYNKGF